MSSLSNQMDSEESSQSLLSTGQSERSSRYLVESGVYMSSFAATIFIAALITIGVLMLTLLVAITVMLDSCESRSAGILEQIKRADQHNYCKHFAFHAELNNLKADEFPTICKQLSFQYINEGQFLQDLNMSLQLIESYFSTLKPDDHLDVILMDIDGIFLSDDSYSSNFTQHWIEDMRHFAHMLVLRLHMKLQSSGWSMVFFTRKPTMLRNATIENLISAGYGGFASLIMRTDDEHLMENWEYISGRRLQLLKQGFRIASVISNQMDAFRGPCLGKRNFKLAIPVYYK